MQGCSFAGAQALTSSLLDTCKTPQSAKAWRALLDFASTIFAQPSRAGTRRSITEIIKNRTERWLSEFRVLSDEHPPTSNRTCHPAESMRDSSGGGQCKVGRRQCQDGGPHLVRGGQPEAPCEQNLKLLAGQASSRPLPRGPRGPARSCIVVSCGK